MEQIFSSLFPNSKFCQQTQFVNLYIDFIILSTSADTQKNILHIFLIIYFMNSHKLITLQSHQIYNQIYLYKLILNMMHEEELFKTVIRGTTYNVCGKIGEGGAGTVFLAKDPLQPKVSYALKIVRLDKRNQLQKKMLDDEIAIQKSFKGNNYVIQYIDVKETQKEVSIILELGEYSLRNALDIRLVTQIDLLNIICDVATGLSSIHAKNVIHRDIKPENIIFKGGVFKITDFGTAIQQQKDDTMAGTVLYWAPEMLFEEQEEFTNSVDIWSLAVTAFECYFKVHPFYPRNKRETQATKQLRTNIKKLTPNFTMQKFYKLLQQYNCIQELNYVKKKMANTKHKQIIENLCRLFEPDPNKRESIDLIAAIFRSIQQSLPPRNPRKTKYNQKLNKNDVPEDVKVFCRAKDLFYDINHDKKSSLYDSTLLGLQLAIWYIQGANYGGIHYIKLDRIDIIKDYVQPKQVLWKLVRKNLSQYYYQIKFGGQEEVKYFDKLNQLRMHILVCSVWMRIIVNSNQFCKNVSRMSGFEILQPLEFMEMLQLISQSKLEQIEEMILTKYYD